MCVFGGEKKGTKAFHSFVRFHFCRSFVCGVFIFVQMRVLQAPSNVMLLLHRLCQHPFSSLESEDVVKPDCCFRDSTNKQHTHTCNVRIFTKHCRGTHNRSKQPLSSKQSEGKINVLLRTITTTKHHSPPPPATKGTTNHEKCKTSG